MRKKTTYFSWQYAQISEHPLGNFSKRGHAREKKNHKNFKRIQVETAYYYQIHSLLINCQPFRICTILDTFFPFCCFNHKKYTSKKRLKD